MRPETPAQCSAVWPEDDGTTVVADGTLILLLEELVERRASYHKLMASVMRRMEKAASIAHPDGRLLVTWQKSAGGWRRFQIKFQ